MIQDAPGYVEDHREVGIILKTGQNILKRYLTLIGLAEDARRWKCGLGEDLLFHIIRECDALPSVRQRVLNQAYPGHVNRAEKAYQSRYGVSFLQVSQPEENNSCNRRIEKTNSYSTV